MMGDDFAFFALARDDNSVESWTATDYERTREEALAPRRAASGWWRPASDNPTLGWITGGRRRSPAREARAKAGQAGTMQIRAALLYYEKYPAEVDAEIAENATPSSELARLIRSA